MHIEDFKRVLTSFADHPGDVDFSRGTITVQIREEIFEAKIFLRSGDVVVEDNGEVLSGAYWLINRVARLSILADRILSYIPEVDSFVAPSGSLLKSPEFQTIADSEEPVSDAAEGVLEALGVRPAGTSTVIYLTSDAGEGKTTVINQIARSQARKFKEKTSDFLLVPIPLGGRSFLRFDDVVVSALVNRLRFQFFYYDAFVELVRMGVIIPAFDGFEEMFIEGSAREAVSALGGLMNHLSSSGSVLIAARKAYFDYQSFQTQTKLFDAIGAHSVSFSRLCIHRWRKDQFVKYAKKRGVAEPEAMYQAVSNRFSASHPLLTRAVLVKRLLDVAESIEDIEGLLNKLGDTPQDYFFQFVNAIVEREANEKWLNKDGEAHSPMLTVDEHHDLLSMVAQEMWLSATDSLKGEILDVIADMFTEEFEKGPVIGRQVKERLKQHSLISRTESPRGQFEFDHEDFRKFFLGQALGRLIAHGPLNDLKAMLHVGLVPNEACDESVRLAKRDGTDMVSLLTEICAVAKAESIESFVRENCGAIAISIVAIGDLEGVSLDSLNFPLDSLRGKQLKRISFEDCYFQPTSLDSTLLDGCSFKRCHFTRLEVASNTHVVTTSIVESEVDSLFRKESDEHIFDPHGILAALHGYGFSLNGTTEETIGQNFGLDEESKLVERFLRIFMRTTQVNETIIRVRLGSLAPKFIDVVLPELLSRDVVQEVEYIGGGVKSQRRFKLNVPMQLIQESLRASRGNFQNFVNSIKRRKS